MHNHPWLWSFAIILKGGYSEERRVGDDVARRTFRPFSINFIRHTDYHRVDLLGTESWSLFVAGPKHGTWRFWDRALKASADQQDFIDWRAGKRADPGWVPDEA